MSSVLHMGDWALCGARISFCWNDSLFRRGSCVVIGLPCVVRGVHAHGSRIVVIAGVAVPHDSAVPTDAECTRVCNTQPPRHTQALTKPPRSGEARPVRSSAPRHRAPHRGDGVRPISTRGTTDLDAGYDRSRRKGRRVRRAGRQAGGQAVRSLRLPAAPATRSSTTASTRQTPGPTHGPPGPSRSRAPPLAPAVPASSTGR